ncbi:Hypothetical_protein [Hexamita inflata]|uniref:Hypothetical_protein n=1 Tax=Hexamita inflata TaxID=28002 RepID=A0AA86PT60_9EUKA|nr:Hypothetical protein HINF_LOCUS31347 [Hexamita inflata]
MPFQLKIDKYQQNESFDSLQLTFFFKNINEHTFCVSKKLQTDGRKIPQDPIQLPFPCEARIGLFAILVKMYKSDKLYKQIYRITDEVFDTDKLYFRVLQRAIESHVPYFSTVSTIVSRKQFQAVLPISLVNLQDVFMIKCQQQSMYGFARLSNIISCFSEQENSVKLSLCILKNGFDFDLGSCILNPGLNTYVLKAKLQPESLYYLDLLLAANLSSKQQKQLNDILLTPTDIELFDEKQAKTFAKQLQKIHPEELATYTDLISQITATVTVQTTKYQVVDSNLPFMQQQTDDVADAICAFVSSEQYLIRVQVQEINNYKSFVGGNAPTLADQDGESQIVAASSSDKLTIFKHPVILHLTSNDVVQCQVFLDGQFVTQKRITTSELKNKIQLLADLSMIVESKPRSQLDDLSIMGAKPMNGSGLFNQPIIPPAPAIVPPTAQKPQIVQKPLTVSPKPQPVPPQSAAPQPVIQQKPIIKTASPPLQQQQSLVYKQQVQPPATKNAFARPSFANNSLLESLPLEMDTTVIDLNSKTIIENEGRKVANQNLMGQINQQTPEQKLETLNKLKAQIIQQQQTLRKQEQNIKQFDQQDEGGENIVDVLLTENEKAFAEKYTGNKMFTNQVNNGMELKNIQTVAKNVMKGVIIENIIKCVVEQEIISAQLKKELSLSYQLDINENRIGQLETEVKTLLQELVNVREQTRGNMSMYKQNSVLEDAEARLRQLGLK